MATILEDTLAQRIAFRMRPLNSDMRQALFGPEGSLGSFSAKIRTAYALKIFEKKMFDRLEVIREMRNTCAHSWAPLSFSTPELAKACHVLAPPAGRHRIDVADPILLKVNFLAACAGILLHEAVTHGENVLPTFAQRVELAVSTRDWTALFPSQPISP